MIWPDCFLDRHHIWWSLDPTIDIWLNFVKKKDSSSLFSFASFYKDASFLLHLVIGPVIHMVIWCFPIWLSSFIKLSHGDLQCKFIQTFFQQFSNLNLVVYKNPESRYILFIIGTRWDRVNLQLSFWQLHSGISDETKWDGKSRTNK